MKNDNSKSKNKKVVNKSKKTDLKKDIKTLKKEEIKTTKLKLKKGMGLNICICLCVFIFIVLFIFIILGIVKYFNNKIDTKNKEVIEENINKDICFGEECFYILDYSIEDRYVYLISKKNISLEEKSIQIDDFYNLERKDIDKYLEYYKKTLEDKKVEVLEISIPTEEQLEKNGCNFKNNTSNVYTCSSEKNWIYSTSYYYDGDISGVMVNIDGLDSHFIFPFDMTEEELDNIYGRGKTLDIGLRVVIKVSINEID